VFWNLIKLNLLFCLFALPSGALLAAGLFTPLGIAGMIFSIVLAFPIGGACCACMFCLSKMIRRDPGYLWFDFKRKFLENFKQAAAPGILCTLFIYVQVFLWLDLMNKGADIALIVAGVVTFIIFMMVAPYIFLQIAYIKLTTSQILGNSLLISFGNAGRSFASALGGSVVWAVFLLLLPGSMPFSPLLLVFGFSISWLLSLMCIWPPVDRQFSIEESLRRQREE